MSRISGLHHVTAIAGEAQQNLDFYTTVLGLRLVKRSVNQDVPGTYHLFYADAVGHPGTDLTFFPWPDLPAGRRGIGLTNEVALAVPADSLGYWAERLARHDVLADEPTTRFGERTLTFRDVHGLALALVETSDARDFTPWPGSPVPEHHQIRGLHLVRMAQRELEPTMRFLTEGMGFRLLGSEDGWQRYALGDGGSGRVLDVQALPDAPRGTWGMGSVHHVAWRVADAATELAAQRAVRAAGAHATDVIDRFWFESVYFKEPGGALFEIATDGPGFAVDEATDSLGERLVLPPWLEPRRAEIEQGLPVLHLATPAR